MHLSFSDDQFSDISIVIVTDCLHKSNPCDQISKNLITHIVATKMLGHTVNQV